MKVISAPSRLLAQASVLRHTRNSLLLSGQGIGKTYLKGNRWIRSAIDRAIRDTAKDLSTGMNSLAKEYGVRDFFLGGGLFDSDPIFAAFSEAVKKNSGELNILRSTFGNESGARGAAAYSLMKMKKGLGENHAVLGIDIGLSNVKFIALDRGANTVCRARIRFSKNDLLSRITEEITGMQIMHIGQKKLRLVSVGIGVPGILEDGKIVRSGIVDITTEGPFDLGTEMSARLKKRGITLISEDHDISPIPVAILNDAEAAAWGEKLCAAGKFLRSFIFLTFGSGLGGALADDKGNVSSIEPGQRTFINGEYGGMDTVNMVKKKDDTFEHHVSTTALLRMINENISVFRRPSG